MKVSEEANKIWRNAVQRVAFEDLMSPGEDKSKTAVMGQYPDAGSQRSSGKRLTSTYSRRNAAISLDIS